MGNFERLKTGLKILFGRNYYNNFVKKEKDLAVLEQRLQTREKNIQKKIPLLANHFKKLHSEVYNKGYTDARRDMIADINSCTGADCSDKLYLDDVIAKISELETYYEKIKKNTGSDAYLASFKKASYKLFDNEVSQIKGHFKGMNTNELDKLLTNTCLCLLNYYQLARNNLKGKTLAIVDCDYVESMKSFKPDLRFLPKNVLKEADSFVISCSILKEYKTAINTQNRQLMNLVNDTIKDLLNPGNILVPILDAKNTLKFDIVERFSKKDNENIKFHEGDLEIINFYLMFGAQFKKIFLLSDDNQLKDYMRVLSWRTYNNLEIRSSGKGRGFDSKEYYTASKERVSKKIRNNQADSA